MSASSDTYALAFDVGTTTLAASLVAKPDGRRVCIDGADNPQRAFGLDVTARLAAGLANEEARVAMSRLPGQEMERLAGRLLGAAGVKWEQVEEVVVAANTVVTHLLLELPLKMLAFPPYRPTSTAGTTADTKRLHWGPSLPLYVFPTPGGYVGGDLVACLHGFQPLPDKALFLDLGTNCEMALTCGDVVWTTSAAAGPAFEAGNLSCGMAAGPGAVAGVTFDGDRLRPVTLGAVPPVGLCGSAALEIVSALLEAGVLDKSGRLLAPDETSSPLGSRVVQVGEEPCFLIHRDAQRMVYLSQKDIRQLQVAKGAIRAGIEVLLQRGGLAADNIATVPITGSFGVKVAAAHLKMVGVLPEKMVEVTRFFPEGALVGAERRAAAGGGAAVDALAARLKVVPLSGTPAFEKFFLGNMSFPR